MGLDLPGFRFHPTEEELLDFYLKRMVQGKKLQFEIITTIHLYRYDPWELPGLAKIGEREWYFYVPRDRKQANGGRPSRTTERGFWKATGCDRPVRSAADPKRLIGLKKTLVYYEGRAPRGSKTDWVMNEYRLPDPLASSSTNASPKDDIVLCKIYRKATSMKELEQRAAAMEEEEIMTTMTIASQNFGLMAASSPGWSDQESFQLKSTTTTANDIIFIEDTEEEEMAPAAAAAVVKEKEEADGFAESMAESWLDWADHESFKLMSTAVVADDVIVIDHTKKEEMAAAAVEEEEEEEEEGKEEADVLSGAVPSRRPSLPELEVPKHGGLEWMQDPFLTQLRSPWMMDHLWSPNYASILNF